MKCEVERGDAWYSIYTIPTLGGCTFTIWEIKTSLLQCLSIVLNSLLFFAALRVLGGAHFTLVFSSRSFWLTNPHFVQFQSLTVPNSMIFPDSGFEIMRSPLPFSIWWHVCLMRNLPIGIHGIQPNCRQPFLSFNDFFCVIFYCYLILLGVK